MSQTKRMERRGRGSCLSGFLSFSIRCIHVFLFLLESSTWMSRIKRMEKRGWGASGQGLFRTRSRPLLLGVLGVLGARFFRSGPGQRRKEDMDEQHMENCIGFRCQFSFGKIYHVALRLVRECGGPSFRRESTWMSRIKRTEGRGREFCPPRFLTFSIRFIHVFFLVSLQVL